MKILRIILLPAFPILAFGQNVELASRYDYYTDEKEATIILFGDDFEDVKQLLIGGVTAEEVAHQKDRRIFRVNIQDLPNWVLEPGALITLKDGSTRSIYLKIKKMPPKPNSVKVDRLTGGLKVDDLPFFPFGFYTGFPLGNLLVEEVYNAMNLVGVYQSNEDETLAGRKAYMDLCADLGVKVNYSLNGLVGTPHNKTDFVITPEEEARRWDLLRKEVETFKDHPALLSWYMNDEPVGQSRSPKLLEKAYKIIKEIDPYHPISVVFVIPERAAAYANAVDIVMTDPYPIPGDVKQVSGHMRALKKHFRYRKAFWLVPQAFGGGEHWAREPTGPEIRVMTWLGILEGAMGIKYFIRRLPNLFPKSQTAWNEAVKAAHEISMLAPWLFSYEKTELLPTDFDGVFVKTFAAENSNLVIAVNSENRPRQLRLSFENAAKSPDQTLRLLFENRTVQLKNFALTEPIDAFGVRVYLAENGNETEIAEHAKHNLFINPGFENCPSPGVPAGCYANSSARPFYDGSTFFVDSRTAHSGRNALRFNTAHDTSQFSLTFFRMNVEKERLYYSEFWSRGPRHGSPAEFTVSIPELEIAQTFQTSPGWKKHTFYFNTTEQTTHVRWQIEPKGKGTFWLDDISILPEPLIDVAVLPQAKARVRLQSSVPEKRLFYRLNDRGDFRAYSSPFEVSGFTNVDLKVSEPDGKNRDMSFQIPLSKATLKKCSFQTPYSEKYAAQGDGTVLDGAYGSLAFRDNKWLGFDGKDVEFTVDLGKSTAIHTLAVHFLVSVNDGIHAPLSVVASVSDDSRRFRSFGLAENQEGSKHGPAYYLNMRIDGAKTMARYVKFKVKSPKIIPKNYLFAGTDAWIFIDEVLIDD